MLLGPAQHSNTWSHKRWIAVGIAASVVALLLVAGAMLLWPSNKQGTLVLSINQPDAAVQIDENFVSLGARAADGKYSIELDPGLHRIKVEKKGYGGFAGNFFVKQGEKTALWATLAQPPRRVVPPASHGTATSTSQANAPFFELDGFNGFWGSAGVPSDAFTKLKEVQKEAKRELKCVAFAPGGQWIFLCGNSDFYTSDPNLPVCKAIEKFRDQGAVDFHCVAFAPTGGWTILWGGNGSWTEGQVPEGAFKAFGDIGTHGGGFRSIAYGPNGAWVFLYDTAGVAYGDIPPSLKNVLDDAVKNGNTVTCVNFFGNDWICLSNNGWWTSNPDSDAARRIAS